MKNYVKPTFILAAASSGQPSSCLVQVDLDLIADFLGPNYDPNNIFGMNEVCEDKIPVEYYCKFTSADTNPHAQQGFLS